jgi:hypothetical protein
MNESVNIPKISMIETKHKKRASKLCNDPLILEEIKNFENIFGEVEVNFTFINRTLFGKEISMIKTTSD